MRIDARSFLKQRALAGGESGGTGGGGGGASVETCSFYLCTDSWIDPNDLVSMSYVALVDGEVTVKTVTPANANFFDEYTDVVKGTILTITAVGDAFYSGYRDDIAEETMSRLFASWDNNNTHYGYIVNGEGWVDFVDD